MFGVLVWDPVKLSWALKSGLNKVPGDITHGAGGAKVSGFGDDIWRFKEFWLGPGQDSGCKLTTGFSEKGLNSTGCS